MEAKITKMNQVLDQLRAEGNNKPVMSYRHIGSRIEVHLLGEYEPRVFEEEKANIDATRLTVKELQKIAKNLGIDPAGMKKADLIQAIQEA